MYSGKSPVSWPSKINVQSKNDGYENNNGEEGSVRNDQQHDS